MEFFSEYFENLVTTQSNYFNSGLIKGAYLIGAYSKAIIASSYCSKISKGNETFKKWLSNQKITEQNLKKIFNKANEFERKLRLGSKRNDDLSTLVTTHFIYKKDTIVTQQEVSFTFVRGFNDYAKFKKDNPIKGEESE